MSGFIRSLLGGFAISALISGVAAKKAAENQPNTAPPALTPTQENHNIVPSPEQRVFGTPGASLHTAYNLDPEARQAGIDGEVRVAQALERLSTLYPNTYIFHSVKLPGKLGDIDHIVVQGNRMLLVDSKNWKHDATYHIYHSTFEADYISRNGEEFAGGEIHLTRQIAEWQIEFMDSSVDVQAVLVIANNTSTVSESINAPYTLANIEGLPIVFESLFNADGAAPLHPTLMQRLLSMVQSVNPTPTQMMPQTAPRMQNPAPIQMQTSAPLRLPATTTTKWLVGWSFFNYTVMMLLFPLAGISVLPLLFMTHRHKAFVQENGLGGSGLLSGVLAFSYILLTGWALTVAMVVMYWIRAGYFS